MTVPEIFTRMASSYVPGRLDRTMVCYFSIGDHRYTATLHPDRCEVATGKTTEHADFVLKAHPDVFEKMVVKGQAPGALDVARGRIKTSDPAFLAKMKELFRV